MLSIIVCTRNRIHFLRDMLLSYENIATNLPWELVVVDNSSTDGSEAFLRSFASSLAMPIRILSEKTPGLSRARNTGWRHASGEILAFSDDDCYLSPDFVDAVWTNFEGTRIHYLGGRVLLHDPMDLPITIQLRETRLELPAGSFIESGLIHGANMAFRREVLEALNGFDEMLGAGTRLPGSDDTDIISRASTAGFHGAYDPRPVVFHHHRRRSQRQADSLMRGYDIGRGAHYMKCVIDPLRRSEVCRQWYWRTLLPALNSRRGVTKLLNETIGACRYLVRRFFI